MLITRERLRGLARFSGLVWRPKRKCNQSTTLHPWNVHSVLGRGRPGLNSLQPVRTPAWETEKDSKEDPKTPSQSSTKVNKSHTWISVHQLVSIASFLFFFFKDVRFLKYLFLWLFRDLVTRIVYLHCAMQDLVPWPGIKPRPPALGAQRVNQWATREVWSPCAWLFCGSKRV